MHQVVSSHEQDVRSFSTFGGTCALRFTSGVTSRRFGAITLEMSRLSTCVAGLRLLRARCSSAWLTFFLTFSSRSSFLLLRSSFGAISGVMAFFIALVAAELLLFSTHWGC